jgi:hypothetical protein
MSGEEYKLPVVYWHNSVVFINIKPYLPSIVKSIFWLHVLAHVSHEHRTCFNLYIKNPVYLPTAMV